MFVDFDGYNLGFTDSFTSTFLVFDSFEDMDRIAKHYIKWMFK